MLNTRKKRIVLVFNRRVSSTLFNNLSRDLKLVFQDDIEVSKIDLQALKGDEIIDADAILLMRHSAVEILKNYVRDPQKLIIVTRTITEEMIFRIYDIPKGSRVLVVNDMPETTADTIVMLHRLGINHLDLIPTNLASQISRRSMQLSLREKPSEFPKGFPISLISETVVSIL